MENTETFIRAKFQRMNLEVTFSNGEKGNEMTIIPEIDEGKRKTVDCVFYTRSGFCRNGESCRFTHSLKSQVDYYLGFGLGQNQVTKEKNPDVKGKSECKFYSTPQGCRNGNACRFAHEKTDVGEGAPGYPRLLVQPGESGNLSAPQPLNVDSRGKIQANSDGTVTEQSLTVSARTRPYSPNAHPYGPSEIPVGPVGLPLRPERPTCMFYRRYGLCKHGIGCQFNHPLNARRGNPASGRSSSNRSKSSTSTTKNGRK